MHSWWFQTYRLRRWFVNWNTAKNNQGHTKTKRSRWLPRNIWGAKNRKITAQDILQNRRLIDRNIFYRNLTRKKVPNHLAIPKPCEAQKKVLWLLSGSIFNLTFLKRNNKKTHKSKTAKIRFMLDNIMRFAFDFTRETFK